MRQELTGKQGLTLHFAATGPLTEVCAHFSCLRRKAELLSGCTHFWIINHEVNQCFWQGYYLSLVWGCSTRARWGLRR